MDQNVSPYGYDPRYEALQRRQKVIDAMTPTELTPVAFNGIPGRQSKLSGLAQILDAAVSGFSQNKLNKDKEAFGQQAQQELTSGVQDWASAATASVPTAQSTPEDQEAYRQSQIAMVTKAVASNNPTIKQLGMTQLGQLGKKPEGQLGVKDLLGHMSPEALNSVIASILPGVTNGAKQPDPMVIEGQPYRPTPQGMAPVPLAPTPGAQPGAPAPSNQPQITWIPGADGKKEPYQQNTFTGKLTKLDSAPQTKITNNVSSSSVNAGQKAGLQEYFKNAAGQVDALGKQANASQDLMGTLQQLDQLAAGGINAGLTSQGATMLQNLGGTLGFKVDKSRLANTEQYNALITEAWQKAVSQYGGNKGVTKDEATEIKNLLPQAAFSPQARTQLSAIMQGKAQRHMAAYKQANASFAKAAAADDPNLFQIPGDIGDSYTPPVGNAPAQGAAMSLQDYLASKKGK